MGDLSYSQLSSLRRCSESLRLEKLNYPQPPAVYLIGGTAYHAACEDFDRLLHSHPSQVDVQFIIERWHEHFEQGVREALQQEPRVGLWRRGGKASISRPNKEDVGVWRFQGEQWCKEYAEHQLVSPMRFWVTPEGEPAIELYMQHDFGDFRVRGAIDRVLVTPDEQLLVRDLKTSSRVPEDQATQLATYAMLMKATFDVRPMWGDYWMSRKNSSTPPVPLDDYTDEMLIQQYGQADKIRRAGLYIASPSNLCKSCGVREGCSAVGGSRAQEFAGLLPPY